jgi:serine acetyltransferase
MGRNRRDLQLTRLIATIGIDDALVVYLIPIVGLTVAWLLASVWVFLLTRRLARSALAGDFHHRLAAKRQTQSGARMTLSFRYVSLALLGDNCVQATVLYRVSNWLARRQLHFLARFVHAFAKFVTHTDISPYAKIDGGLYLYHGLGTVIGRGTTIGRNALICQNVTTGGGPIIGDDVKLWAGAKVIGRVVIGDRAEIGANGVVISDIPADTIAVGVPATRWLPKKGSVGTGRSQIDVTPDHERSQSPEGERALHRPTVRKV